MQTVRTSGAVSLQRHCPTCPLATRTHQVGGAQDSVGAVVANLTLGPGVGLHTGLGGEARELRGAGSGGVAVEQVPGEVAAEALGHDAADPGVEAGGAVEALARGGDEFRDGLEDHLHELGREEEAMQSLEKAIELSKEKKAIYLDRKEAWCKQAI